MVSEIRKNDLVKVFTGTKTFNAVIERPIEDQEFSNPETKILVRLVGNPEIPFKLVVVEKKDLKKFNER